MMRLIVLIAATVPCIEASTSLAAYTSASCLNPPIAGTGIDFSADPVTDFTMCQSVSDGGGPSFGVKMTCGGGILQIEVYTTTMCSSAATETYTVQDSKATDFFTQASSCIPTHPVDKYLSFGALPPGGDKNPCNGAGGAAGVGGDPITYFAGVEHKFFMPNDQLIKFLQTKDLTIYASAFPGEAADEQWIERVVVDSAAGERIVDVSVRRDITRFNRKNQMPGQLESIEVRAPWVSEQPLALPPTDHQTWGAWTFGTTPLVHGSNVFIDILRNGIPDGGNKSVPHREGVLISADSVKLMVISTSALEYYWDDDDDDRALQYAHLDFDVWGMHDTKSITGMLPEVWGLLPKTSQSQWSLTGPTEQKQNYKALKTEILTNMLAADGPEVQSPATSTTRATQDRAITKEILANLLSPSSKGHDERTSASVCGRLQCSLPTHVVV